MNQLFSNHYANLPVYKHRELPIIETGEFDFYRCVPFEDSFYGKTVSELHKGNLRLTSGRYSNLFSNRKISYWASNRVIARAEVKKHGASNSLLTFFAYDDATASFPTLSKERKFLRIIDGIHFGFIEIMLKVENGNTLTNGEKKLLQQIEQENPDCLAYESVLDKNKTNYIFFEKGFNKLAIRDVRLRIDENGIINKNRIVCAGTCDYSARLENYGEMFLPKTKIGQDPKYVLTEEYNKRKQIQSFWYQHYFNEVRKGPHFTISVDTKTGEVKYLDE